jgi:hypothetical protein
MQYWTIVTENETFRLTSRTTRFTTVDNNDEKVMVTRIDSLFGSFVDRLLLLSRH